MRGTRTYNYQILMGARDEPPSNIKEKGITLLECMQYIPSMYDFVHLHGIKSFIVRGNVVSNVQEFPASDAKSIIIHPYDADILELFYANIIAKPSCIDEIHIQELESGMIIHFASSVENMIYISFPHSATWTKDEVRFFATNHPLNEFGLFYVALYIAGNYARYFPDKWLVDIDRASPLALAVEELIAQAEQRVPLLALSELTRNYLVPE